MLYSDLEKINESAISKSEVSNQKPGIYIMKSIMAGFYIVIAIMLSYVTGAVLYEFSPALARVATAACFSIGIMLILFIGGELFTGNNFIMAVSVYDRKISFKNLIKIWIYSYIGNFIGCVFLSFLFVKSGASFDILKNYIKPIAEAKLHISAHELFLRGILCNFIVCISVFVSIKLKSDTMKIFLIFSLISTFVVAGFEHSIANMSIFSICFIGDNGFSLALAAKNLLFVTLGNIVGGSILFGYPLKLICTEK